MSPMQTLPGDAAALTPEFLSGALGTEVTAVEVLDHAFATNQRAKIALTYAEASAGPGGRPHGLPPTFSTEFELMFED